MSLTRNLYREDEVLAALRMSLIHGKTADALFWVQEGIESDMDIAILQTMLSVWLNCVGVQNIPWLGWLVESLRGDLDEEIIVTLTVELARSKKDSSVFALQGLGLAPVADHVGQFALPASLKGLGTLETAFAKALIQGKNEFAWSLATPLWENGRADEILWEIQPLAVFNKIQDALESIWSDDFIWPFRALAILMATHRRDFIGTPRPPCPPDHMCTWNERKELPMRKRRVLSVPPECLYWLTRRGNMRTSKTTEKDIMGNLRHMCSSSPFWSGISEEMHDTYFPSDIPDEWSSADRQKSHGRGVVPAIPNPDHQILFDRFLRRMYGSVPSKQIWRGCERANEILVSLWSRAKPVSFERGIADAYASLEIPVEKWDLTGCRRIVLCQ